MLEIIALIFLTKNMGNLASQKGLKPGTWKLYTVLAWFGGEIVGVLLGILAFGEQGLLVPVVLGLACAIISYFVLKAQLSKKPDMMDEDINRIGVEDLRP
jgi:Zn-dependent protease with chaperone function